MKAKAEEIWDKYRETLTPSQKGQLTRFKNFLEEQDKETLAMNLAMQSMGNPECLNLFKKGYVNYFYNEFPENDSNFVAFFSDGSGAILCSVTTDGTIYGSEIGEIPEMEWFIDAEYGSWQYLPDNFEIEF